MLGLDRDQFTREWSLVSADRMVGVLSTKTALLHICRRLGVLHREDRIQASVEVRFAQVRDGLTPRHGTVETLSSLRDRGLCIGLISNCSEEVSRLWDSTPFASLVDAAGLSCEVGLEKPDPQIYSTASERLGVYLAHCLFVGDGSGGELSGASQAGMKAVLMRAPDDQDERQSDNARLATTCTDRWCTRRPHSQEVSDVV